MDAALPARRGWRQTLQAPLVALEFLTVLRLRRPAVVESEALAASVAFFPAVGLLLGAVLAGSDWVLRDALGPGITGWVLVALLLALTGALHADGLADTFDGLFGGHTPERRLAIMRDSSIGAFGACALIVVLALKATAFGQLAQPHRAEVLLLAPCLSRWACVVAIASFPYARGQGLGVPFRAGTCTPAAVLAGAIAAGAAVVLLGLDGVAGWGLALGAGLAIGAFIAPKLGGLTGDAYGAIVEITETLGLLAAIAWLQ
ncbi:MAG TPA: adenosylcobinamide-GDP ribazoletransferase [Dehalococcoidia bacterium]